MTVQNYIIAMKCKELTKLVIDRYNTARNRFLKFFLFFFINFSIHRLYTVYSKTNLSLLISSLWVHNNANENEDQFVVCAWQVKIFKELIDWLSSYFIERKEGEIIWNVIKIWKFFRREAISYSVFFLRTGVLINR